MVILVSIFLRTRFAFIPWESTSNMTLACIVFLGFAFPTCLWCAFSPLGVYFKHVNGMNFVPWAPVFVSMGMN